MKHILFSSLLLLFCLLCGCHPPLEKSFGMEKPSFPAFQDLTIGGELRDRLLGNFNRLEQPLYQPDEVFVSEEESNGWPGDKEGRTILALTLEAQLTKRKPVYLDQIIHAIPSKVNEKGYFGTIHEGLNNEQQLASHGWVLRGLCEYYQWNKDTLSLGIIKNIVHNLFLPGKGLYAKYPIDPTIRDTSVGAMSGTTQKTVDGWILSSDIGCIFIGMDGLIQAYQVLRWPEIKEVIDEMIGRFLEIDLKRIKAQTHASLTALRGLLRYMEITEDYSLLPEIKKRWALYLSNGMTENYENYNWFDRFDSWSEPCAVVDSYMVAMQLWQITQDTQYLHQVELIYYNGLCHAQRANGGFGCDNCPGNNDCDLRVHADEAYWCCTMRGGEGLSRIGEYSTAFKNDTVYILQYRDLTARFFNAEKRNIIISERTQYPFSNSVEMDIIENNIGTFTLKVFIPSWTSDHQLFVNESLTKITTENGYILITKDFKKSDSIRLLFNLVERKEPVINIHHSESAYYRLFNGPLQLGESNGEISPVYHLMDKNVVFGDYSKKILFEK